jgi:hypothetical protein
MPSMIRPETGFSGKPKALRRAILEVLRRQGRLTAAEIAGAVYASRITVRPGYVGRHATTSQLVSVRRALRRMVAKGRVEVLYRRRHWKIFVLRQEAGE